MHSLEAGRQCVFIRLLAALENLLELPDVVAVSLGAAVKWDYSAREKLSKNHVYGIELERAFEVTGSTSPAAVQTLQHLWRVMIHCLLENLHDMKRTKIPFRYQPFQAYLHMPTHVRNLPGTSPSVWQPSNLFFLAIIPWNFSILIQKWNVRIEIWLWGHFTPVEEFRQDTHTHTPPVRKNHGCFREEIACVWTLP